MTTEVFFYVISIYAWFKIVIDMVSMTAVTSTWRTWKRIRNQAATSSPACFGFSEAAMLPLYRTWVSSRNLEGQRATHLAPFKQAPNYVGVAMWSLVGDYCGAFCQPVAGLC